MFIPRLYSIENVYPLMSDPLSPLLALPSAFALPLLALPLFPSRPSVRPAVILLLLAYYYYRHERKWWGGNEPRPSPYHSLHLNLAVKFT